MDQTRLQKLLSEKGYSVTRQRLLVFNKLRGAEEPVTVTHLATSLHDIDKASVYRTVELFEKIGIIHRVWSGFKSKIELSDEFSAHHHHFTCLDCGKTIGLESEVLENNLREFETEHGFKLTQHSVELSGYCRACLAVK